MTRVLYGLGSNLGDRMALLGHAVQTLRAEPGIAGLRVESVSDVYETDPVGGPDQDRFLNLVVALDDPAAAPDAWAHLGVCHRLEADARRERIVRWGPRTLDVDLLWIDGITVDAPDLIVPHPRMFERRFVVAPLADVAADLAPPGWDRALGGVVDRVGPLS